MNWLTGQGWKSRSTGLDQKFVVYLVLCLVVAALLAGFGCEQKSNQQQAPRRKAAPKPRTDWMRVNALEASLSGLAKSLESMSDRIDTDIGTYEKKYGEVERAVLTRDVREREVRRLEEVRKNILENAGLCERRLAELEDGLQNGLSSIRFVSASDREDARRRIEKIRIEFDRSRLKATIARFRKEDPSKLLK